MKKFVDSIFYEYHVEQIKNEPCSFCVRGIRNDPNINATKFVPSYKEPSFQRKKFVTGIDQLSVSIFVGENEFKNKIKGLKKFRTGFIAIASGKTCEDKGIAEKPDETGHINYFLYDYENNNPYCDFTFMHLLGNDYWNEE